MLLSKEEFCKYINQIKKLDKADNELRQWCKKYTPDTDVFLCDLSLQSELVELLDRVMHPADSKDFADDISYFVYELDYGENYQEGSVLDENNNPIDFSTAEKLYDYLKSLCECESNE